MKQVQFGQVSAAPAITIETDDSSAGLRVVHQGSGNAIEVVNKDGTIWTPNNGATPVAYTIVPDGSGGAYAYAGDAGLLNYSGANSADVFQSAINAIALQNGGKGGRILFKGQHVWNKSVTAYPAISLVGEGPNGVASTQNSGSQIQATYNGDVLVVSGVSAANDYFPYLGDFAIWGTAGANQDLIVFSNAAGDTPWDVYMDHVLVYAAGRNGVRVDTTAASVKLMIDWSYLESSVQDGLNFNVGTLRISNSYIFGNGRYGIWQTSPDSSHTSSIYVHDNLIWNNTAAGLVLLWAGRAIVSGNDFNQNGSNNVLNPQALLSQAAFLSVTGNNFNDPRGGAACAYHMRLSRLGSIAKGSISGNTFGLGGQTAPIYYDYVSGNKALIQGNSGFNDTYGKVASPFQAGVVPAVGFMGAGSATPVASTAYRADGAPLLLAVSGGTGVSITIADPAGNTVQSGLASYNGTLSPGYTINFGAFTVAPTVYVGVL